MKTKHILGAFAVTFSVVAASAHTGATGVTLERMQGMTALADAMKSIAPMVRGEVAHDADIVAAAAAVLSARSGPDMVELFVEGTGMAPSEAAPNIWSDPDGFAAISDELNALAIQLAASARSPEQTAQLFRQIGRTCSGCHEDYRIKRD